MGFPFSLLFVINSAPARFIGDHHRSGVSVAPALLSSLPATLVSGSISDSIASMGSKGRSHHWSAFDGVKSFPSTPEALMAEINAATANLEYAAATALLESRPPSAPRNRVHDAGAAAAKYDVRVADEAYRAGCAALAAGKLDEALHSLNVSLSNCPPDKTSAVAKLQSLITITSQQLRKSPI